MCHHWFAAGSVAVAAVNTKVSRPARISTAATFMAGSNAYATVSASARQSIPARDEAMRITTGRTRLATGRGYGEIAETVAGRQA